MIKFKLCYMNGILRSHKTSLPKYFLIEKNNNKNNFWAEESFTMIKLQSYCKWWSKSSDLNKSKPIHYFDIIHNLVLTIRIL